MASKESAMRFNTGKSELSYLLDFPEAISQMADVAAFGAEKYARNNWKKGLDVNQVVDSLLRHLSSFKAGEIIDPESGKPHTGHIIWNAMALAETLKLHPEDVTLWEE